MTRRFLLESFDTSHPVDAADTEVLAQEKWLEAFEKGYKDGWEDAERTLSQRQGQISDAFAQNLMDLTFTLGEARAAVRRDLSALLRGVLTALMPETLVHLLGPQILAELDDLAAEYATDTFEVLVSADQKLFVERALAGAGFASGQVIAAPEQPRDSAMIRFGAVEREVDLAAALREIASMVETYFDEHDSAKERSHG